MRVLYWTTTFKPDIGGVEVFSIPLIHALQQRGVEFLVVASRGQTPVPDDSECEGIRVRRFPFYRALLQHDLGQMGALIRTVADLKRTFQPDLIHINTTLPDTIFHQRTSDTWSCPVLFTLHERIVAQDQNSLFGRLIRNADWVTAVSQYTLAEVRSFMPEIAARSSAIPNGFEAPAIEPTPIDWDRPRLLCFGRVVEGKGFDLAVRAFAEIQPRVPAARLRIAGDGDYRSSLEALAASLGLGSVVEFLGWVAPERIPALIDDSALVLMPSRHEAFGLAAVQTGQMARSIIATAVGGLPEVILDGETGFLVENEQPAQIAEKAYFLLTHPQQGNEMGRAARQRALGHYSMDRVVAEYHQLYRMLAS